MQTNDTRKCPMCGATVVAHVKSCESCGESLLPGSAGKAGRVRVSFTAQLPEICALCGEAATRRNRILFRQGRENLGRPIMLPVCHRHRFFGPVAWRELIRLIFIVPFLILAAVGFLVQTFGSPIALLSGAGLFTAFVCFVVWIIWQGRGPRSPFEDSTHIVLVGVAPEFAQACEEIDDREAEQVGDNLEQMFAEISREQSQRE